MLSCFIAKNSTQSDGRFRRLSRYSIFICHLFSWHIYAISLLPFIKTHARFLFVYVSLPKTHVRFPFVSVCLQETHARFQHPPSLQEMFESHTFLQQIRSESGQFCGRCSHRSLYKKKGFQDTAKTTLTCHSCWLFPLLSSRFAGKQTNDWDPSLCDKSMRTWLPWSAQKGFSYLKHSPRICSVSPFDSFAATLEFLPNASIFLGSRRMETCANLACARVLAHFQVPQPSQQRKPSNQSQKKAPRSKKSRMLKMQTCKT